MAPAQVLALGEAAVRALVEAAPDAVVVADAAGRVVLVNRQTEVLFGYGRGELLGQPVELLVPEARRAVHTDHRVAYASHPRTRPMGAGLALSGRHKDGSEIPVEISLAPISVEHSAFVVAIVRDMAERRRAEQARRAADERLAQLGEAAEGLARAADLATIGAILAGQGRRALGAASVALAVLAETGSDLDAVAPAPALPNDQETAARVAATGAAAWSEAGAWLPLRSATGVVGVLAVTWPDGRARAAEERLAVTALARQCAQAVERARLRARAERARVAAVAERQRALEALDSVTDGFFAVDSRWCFTYANAAAARLLGRPGSDLIGRPVWEGASSLASGLFGEQLQWAAERRVVVGFEYSHRATGAWYDVRGYPSPDGLSVFLRETTARKRAEAELRASEERFRLLVEGARDHALYLLDPDGRVVSWDAGAQRQTGHTSEDIVGRDFALLFPDEDARTGVPRQLLDRAAADGRAEWEGWRLRKDGTRFWAHRTITALRDAKGSLRGFANVTADLTERHRAEEEQASLFARLQEALTTRDQVLVGVAHDLRSPLAAIQLAVAMVVGTAEQPQPDRAILRGASAIARQSVDRMARWVEELRDASRLQVGEQPHLTPEPVDLVSLVHQLADEHKRLASGHRIGVAAAKQEVVGLWDRARIERVVDNLLGNAVKYSRDGSAVAVEVEESEGWAVLRVRDEGVGIPRQDLARLFDLFQRGSNVAERLPGSGIGLAVVKAAVQRHGGAIEVDSTLGIGSTFTVRLPLAPPDEPGAPR